MPARDEMRRPLHDLMNDIISVYEYSKDNRKTSYQYTNTVDAFLVM